MGRYVGMRVGRVHERRETSEYYCGGCGWPVTDHDSFCPECGGALRERDADCPESENDKLKAENERLREQVARHKEIDAALARADEDLHVIEGRYGINLTNAELYMLCDAVYAINAKLRELVREADRIMQGVLDNATDTVTVSDLPCCDTLFDRLVDYRLKMRRLGLELSDAQLKELRELGIEVD